MLLQRLLLTEVNCCHNELRKGRWDNEGVRWMDLLHVEVDLGLEIKISIQRAFCIRQWQSIWRAIQILPRESDYRMDFSSG